MRYIIFLLTVMSSFAMAQDIQCNGLDTYHVLRLEHGDLRIYKIKSQRIMRGTFVTLEEIGTSMPLGTETIGRHTYYSGMNFELVIKDDQGIVTRSTEDFLRGKRFVCRPIKEPHLHKSNL